MAEYVIKAENLSKSYRIRYQADDPRGQRYTTLRDLVSSGIQGIGQRLLGRANGYTEGTYKDFWALKNIAFEINQCDRIGIIGRNGAGKSTLLKILSRITEPTAGRVHIRGRLASLLEVGTGFHPELTGRENIYLNGAVLGMSRQEIQRKFDEIVAFAEIGFFLDTPVKRYSSGMYVRLAFAVAAHLEPEILIVDEVLAVGDVQFQKKCLGKMQHIAEQEQRTVIFVSHNMEAIRALCTKVIHLELGEIVSIGPVAEVIQEYLHPVWQGYTIAPDTPYHIGLELTIQKLGITPALIFSGSNVQIELAFYSTTIAFFSEIALLIYSDTGIRVAALDLRKADTYHQFDSSGHCAFRITLNNLPLVEGGYYVGLYLQSTHVNGNFLELTKFTVYPQAVATDSLVPYPSQYRGLIQLDYTFSAAGSCHGTEMRRPE